MLEPRAPRGLTGVGEGRVLISGYLMERLKDVAGETRGSFDLLPWDGLLRLR